MKFAKIRKLNREESKLWQRRRRRNHRKATTFENWFSYPRTRMKIKAMKVRRKKMKSQVGYAYSFDNLHYSIPLSSVKTALREAKVDWEQREETEPTVYIGRVVKCSPTVLDIDTEYLLNSMAESFGDRMNIDDDLDLGYSLTAAQDDELGEKLMATILAYLKKHDIPTVFTTIDGFAQYDLLTGGLIDDYGLWNSEKA